MRKIPDQGTERHTGVAGTNDSARQRRPADRGHHRQGTKARVLSVSCSRRRNCAAGGFYGVISLAASLAAPAQSDDTGR